MKNNNEQFKYLHSFNFMPDIYNRNSGQRVQWGFYVSYVNGISFKNVVATTQKYDFRSAYVFDDVQVVNMDNVYINGNIKRPQIILRNVTGQNLKGKSELVKTVK